MISTLVQSCRLSPARSAHFWTWTRQILPPRYLHLTMANRSLHCAAGEREQAAQIAVAAAEALRACQGNYTTDFVPGRLVAAVAEEAARCGAGASDGVALRAGGGHSHAGRVRLCFSRPAAGAVEESETEPGIAALCIQGQFLFDPLEPGDIEAAAALAGVAVSELGDVLGIGDGGAHCLATPEAAVRLESALHNVRPGYCRSYIK